MFDRNRAYLTSIGGVSGINSGNFNEPTGIDLDGDGNLYVADHHNQRIQKFTSGIPYWTQANINGFGERWNGGVSALEVFSDSLYAGASNWVDGGRIWKSTDGRNWTPASEYGVGSGYAELNLGIIDMIAFDGQLYVGTGWGGYPGQIWRSTDGITWNQVVGDGFGNLDNYAVIRFAVYNNQLYAATGNDAGTEIWRSTSGDLGDWQPVLGAGNGDPDNNTLSSFAVYDGSLYAAVQNETEGAQVWRSPDGGTWSQVNDSGFGDADNIHIGSILVYSNTLYAATRNDTTGAQVWRSNNGTDWYQVMGDGFGNPNNMKIESLYAFDGELYAASDNEEPGMEVWRSSDGVSWEQVNIGGFGDCNNDSTLWNNATAVFKDQLYYGTWNGANGGEIWRYTPQLIYLPVVMK